MRLTLFFTRGLSLWTWVESGMVAREVALYQALQARGIEVSFVTYGGPRDIELGREHVPGITILCNRWQLSHERYIRWLPLLHALPLARTDAIKTNQTNGARIAQRGARWWRKPLIARCGYMWSTFMGEYHGPESEEAQQAHEVEQEVFAAAAKVVVTAPHMAADVRERIPQADVAIIPNYVDTDLFRPMACEPAYDVIFVGRLHRQKNIRALCAALAPLDVTALIVGRGPLADDLHAQYGERFTWRDHVPNEDLPALINQARLFLLPSRFEGHPKTLIEAMACGAAAIGADSPGIRDVIRHGETGWLSGTESASIAEAVTHLLARPDLRRALGEAARAYAVEHYALDRIADMEIALLKEVTQ